MRLHRDRSRPRGKVIADEGEQFWHTLALGIGCFVSEAKERCTLQEFERWQAYYKIHPFGEFRSDVRAAIIATAIAEAAGAKRVKVQDFLAENFIGIKARGPKQTVEQMAAIFANYARLHNNKISKAGAQESQRTRSAN